MSRPEDQGPAELYYGDAEAQKYTNNSRIQKIQAEMTHRALELLALPPDQPLFLLDIGCGSGLSGEILDELGYIWAGVDIAPSMLQVALEREVEGDLFLQDIGQGFGFRPGSFDGAISISVLQWLLTSPSSHPNDTPPARLTRFFTTLYAVLRNPSRAVFQFYPETDDQITLITTIARKPASVVELSSTIPIHARHAKCSSVSCMDVDNEGLPRGLNGEDPNEEKRNVTFERRRARERLHGKKKKKGGIDKEWILKKKELYRQRGKQDVPNDSKYTGRRRKPVF
ncbi:probable BUD23-Protein involved in bud-site selection [Serendipita indica DSM 11827]|uniref:Probable BUD23-Protein involved in bud-site selection n=1 Tax=Serendipita indica (strain DSM 11827) TaxID=1109443 RepID=G4TEP1_SERID|nr:probable BUD23-Protein involved in bud-site selection [Serendipita indica DSM 11827]